MTTLRITLLCAICVVLFACGRDDDAGSTPAAHLERARQFIDGADYTAAITELKSALLLEKQSAEARWLLGRAYLASGDALSAEKELARAIDMGRALDDVQPDLAEALLVQDKHARLRELSDAGLNSSAAAALLAVQALSAMELGERHRAFTLIDSALAQDPDSNRALLAKSQILVTERDFAGAELVLERVMPLEQGNALAWRLLGDVRVGLKKPDEALIAYDKALAIREQDQISVFKRALLYLQLGDYEAAQRDTSELLRLAPQQSSGNYLQGLIHFQAGRYGEAATRLWIAVRDAEQYPLALFFLSCAQLLEGDVKRASEQASQFYKQVPDSVRARKLLAFLRLQQARHQDVYKLLDPVLRINPEDIDALNLVSGAMLRDNRVEEGITLIGRVAAQGPDASFDKISLGAGRLLSGNSDDAAEYLETTLYVDPKLQQQSILSVMGLLHDKNYKEAVSAAKAYKRRNPTSATAINLLGRTYLAAGEQDEAKTSFEQALKLHSGDSTANHNLAQLALAAGDTAAARSYYSKTLEYRADDLLALIQLAGIDEAQQRGESRVTHLKRAKWAHDDSLEPRLLLGRYHLGEGRPELVSMQFKDLEEVQQQLPQVLQLNALAKLAIEENVQEALDFEEDTWDRRLIANWVRRLAPEYGLDPDLILAVIQAESNFNPGARSHANALGLMQLIPATAARFGVRDRADPVQNLHGGMAYLRWLLSFFDGDVRLSLAGYNAGEGAVVKYLGVPPYRETQNYVRKIMKSYGRNRHPRIDPVVKPTRFMASIRANQRSRML